MNNEIKRMQYLAGLKSNNSIIELNTSFLQSKDDFERGGDYGYTVFKPEFKNGLEANQQNFKSSGNSAIPAFRYKFNMVDYDGDEMPYINIEFKKPLSEVFIDLDDYDPDEFGVEDWDKFDSIINEKQNPTLQDVSELINITDRGLSFYGCYVKDIKSNEIIKISKENN